jgi:hypothetical protein
MFRKLYTAFTVSKTILRPKQITSRYRDFSKNFSTGFEKKLESPKFNLFLGGTVVAIILVYKSCAVVPAGCVGVVDFFGNVSKDTLKPGFHFINPLSKVSTVLTIIFIILGCKIFHQNSAIKNEFQCSIKRRIIN